LFEKYLLTENISPVSLKNYLSDFRHFVGWVTFYVKSNHVGVGLSDPNEKGAKTAPLQYITVNVISEYRSYLTTNNIPHKTINRRLSTVRKFCSFCISQGWMKENPAKKVINVISSVSERSSDQRERNASLDFSPAKRVRNDLLKEFQNDLIKEKLDQIVITSYLDDIRDFLSI
ncbi:MAG: phage integrase SAM-like domain-containing protein, partial [Candidatus Woesebacteria bacterium]|nr:phage integrase SAM-like domain-containing protein [Candidatus Woesebacteria bacterium]